MGIYPYEFGPPDPPKPWPSHLVVTSVHRIRDRVFEHGRQPLVDWVICYGDGTADAISLSPAHAPPAVGWYYNRTQALNGFVYAKTGFLAWTPGPGTET